MTPGEKSAALVNAEWLAERLQTPQLAVLDATFFLPNQGRDARREFGEAHIPGARFFDIDEIADRGSSLPHMLPAAQQFAEEVGKLGIDNDTRVVVYDTNAFMASARAWWTFRVFGHADVLVLDGGLERWKALSLPLSAQPAAVTRRSFSARLNAELVRNLEQMRALSEEQTCQILDARSPGRFSGSEAEVRPGLRRGHIPGSRNLYFQHLIDPVSGMLRAPSELIEAYRRAGVDLDKPVVTTCGSGVTASILALGLYCVGRKTVPVYDGSWSEWGAREDTPIATGP